MKSQSNYVPPPYVPLEQSDAEAEIVPLEQLDAEAEIVPLEQLDAEIVPRNEDVPTHGDIRNGSTQWSSDICDCFDDMDSCCVGLFCPSLLFAENAEILGSGTLIGSCMTHFVLFSLCDLMTALMTDGIILGLPRCFAACYACGYRQALRSKYNLQGAPCEDFVTHYFCHQCAICQEYREIRKRSGDSGSGDSGPDLKLAVVTAPAVQTILLGSKE